MGFLCIVGALLNIAINRLAAYEPLLFLDTIMTVSFTLLFGPLWGVITGALTNIISESIFFRGWEAYMFLLCNVATALITWFFICMFPRELNFNHAASIHVSHSRRLGIVMDRLIVLAMLAFVLCLAMSILGGLISAFIGYLHSSSEIGSNPASIVLIRTLFNGDIPAPLAEILVRIPINIIDRLITAFAGYGIALAVFRLKRRINWSK
jgi:hypothetical protein